MRLTPEHFSRDRNCCSWRVAYPPLALSKMSWSVQMSAAELRSKHSTPDPQLGNPTCVLLVRSPYSRTRIPRHLHPLCHEKPAQMSECLGSK